MWETKLLQTYAFSLIFSLINFFLITYLFFFMPLLFTPWLIKSTSTSSQYICLWHMTAFAFLSQWMLYNSVIFYNRTYTVHIEIYCIYCQFDLSCLSMHAIFYYQDASKCWIMWCCASLVSEYYLHVWVKQCAYTKWKSPFLKWIYESFTSSETQVWWSNTKHQCEFVTSDLKKIKK